RLEPVRDIERCSNQRDTYRMSTAAHTERRKDDRRIKELSDLVAALDANVSQLTRDMAPLLELFADSKEAFRLFNKMMGLIRWFIRKAMLPLAFIIGGIYALAHHGRPPEWIKGW